jgi:polar amino acid transport system substrate-binding protein
MSGQRFVVAAVLAALILAARLAFYPSVNTTVRAQQTQTQQSPTRQSPTQQSSDSRVADLVQAGKIRVGLGLGNHASAMKDAATGEMHGMAVDLARALAARIGVALDVVEYPRPGAVFDGAQTDAWDVTFLVIDPERAAAADVSPAYMQSEFTYLVPSGSTIRDVSDVDRPGTSIGVPRGDAVDLSLSRILKQATLVRAESQAAGIDLLRAGQVNAYAAPRPALLALSAQVPGSHVLADAFATTSWAAFVPKGHDERLAYVSAFVEDAKADGMVAQFIEREGLRGIEITPPAKRE